MVQMIVKKRDKLIQAVNDVFILAIYRPTWYDHKTGKTGIKK